MKFTLRHRDELVGAFVLAGILFLVGALLFMGFNQRWFQRDPEYRSLFNTAEGLNPGLALELQGFAIGRVRKVQLTDEHLVEVVFSIHQEHAELIRPGSVVELVVQPLGFGSKLVLYPGKGHGEPLPEGALIHATESVEGQALVASGAVERPRRRDEAALLLAALPDLVAEIETLVVATHQMVARLDEQLLGPADASAEGLLATTAGVMLTMEEAVAGASDLTASLQPILGELDQLLRSARVMAARLEAAPGLIPALLGSEGSAARFFEDDGQLYDELVAAMSEMRAILGFFNQTTPELAALVEEATAALNAGEKVAQGLQNNPLLRGGIAPAAESPGTFAGHRGKGQ
jgi:phospholipid/cholesterol/gamma-HCH transport system substrate-binding protein